MVSCLEPGKVIYNVLKQHYMYLRYTSDEHDKIFDQSSLIDSSIMLDKGPSSYDARENASSDGRN
jgi:hypothetical protein